MIKIIEEILWFQNLLACSLEELQKVKLCDVSKYHYGENASYSVFINNDECMFVDDKLHSIELYSYNHLFSSVEQTISKLNEMSIEWSFFQKYTFDHYLVIKIQEYVYIEYSFDENNSSISVIRISDKE